MYEAVFVSVRMRMGELAAGAAKESHSLLCHLDGFPHLKRCRSLQERGRERRHKRDQNVKVSLMITRP